MPKYCVWIYLLIFNSPLIDAQVKDTLRQNIDYRKLLNNPAMTNDAGETSQSRTELKKVKNPYSVTSRDTIRDNTNYKKLYLMRSSFRSRPIHPFNYFFGLQLNQAYRYVFEDNDWPTQANPYWLTFNFNHKNSGYGTGLLCR